MTTYLWCECLECGDEFDPSVEGLDTHYRETQHTFLRYYSQEKKK